MRPTDSPRRQFRVAATIASIAATSLTACDRPIQPPPPIEPAKHEAEWDAWKSNRLKIITTPGRPMSFTGMKWLRPGANSVGSDPEGDVVLVGRGIPPIVGTLFRDGPRVRFDPAPRVVVAINDTPAVARPLRTDGDSGPSSRVTVGTAGFRIIKRVDSIGVRSWDLEHPALKTFPGLDYFPLASAWRVGGKFVPLRPTRKVPLMTEAGVPEEYEIVGTVKTRIGDSTYNLIAFAGNRPDDLFLVFSDASSGDETYGFRFMHSALDTLAKVVTLDFNYAFNPDCAFSAFTTCPLPLPENRIRTKVLAGEVKLREPIVIPASLRTGQRSR